MKSYRYTAEEVWSLIEELIGMLDSGYCDLGLEKHRELLSRLKFDSVFMEPTGWSMEYLDPGLNSDGTRREAVMRCQPR